MRTVTSIAVCLLLSLVHITNGQGNICSSHKECGKCITSAGCVWCADEDFHTLYPSGTRCDKKASIDQTCKKKISPSSEMNIPDSGKKPVNDDTQVSPQAINLKLRPGQAASFEVKIRPAKNYPADLYFLMDFTNSMKDDIAKFRKLDIIKRMRAVTSRFQLGIGAFADKTVGPFVDEATFKSCGFNPACTQPYAFLNILKLTPSEEDFKKALDGRDTSGNNDAHEDSFDGLMQLAVCDSAIGWKPIDTSRRLIVLMTDQPYHVAGDGKLGGIVTLNDGKCHLNSANRYSKENDMDYPSVSFLKQKLKASKILPVFAVTKTQEAMYEALAKEWKELGAVYGVLAEDSANIMDLVAEAYNKIASTVTLIDDSPSNIKVEYTAVGCKGNAPNECRNVAVGSTVTFRVSVTATACSSNKDDTFRVGIAGFGDVQVKVSYICSCECENKAKVVPNSPRCNNNGAYACGGCYCNAGRFGSTCQCDRTQDADDSLCYRFNNTNLEKCSGAGNCICGQCVCNKQSNAEHQYTGKYCECNNFLCDQYDGKICGGSERGTCDCGKCQCRGVWIGSNCGKKNCTKVAKDCIKDGVECGDKGTCKCGTCECADGYTGRFCEQCPGCPGVCEKNQVCIICQAFNEGPSDACKQCNLDVKVVNATLKDAQCNIRDSKECLITYKYVEHASGNFSFIVSEERRCPVTIYSKPNILAIVLGTIGGILLAGLIALLLWKLLISAYDRYEYNRFEKERAKAQWERTENPLYIPSKQKFDNPMYAGGSKPSS